nr:hypothetical protein [Tanacetum cinerariifolium]
MMILVRRLPILRDQWGEKQPVNTPTDDPKKMSEEDVKNMLAIVRVSEFKVEALQVKYPLIDWEIHSKGSRTYWKIIRAGGITEAYQSFEDMLKGFDRKDLDALWRLVKEKFSTAMPTVNREKALWVELKILYEPNAADVFWKLQRCNLNGYNAVQNVDNQVIQNAVQNPRVQNIGNQNGLIGVLGNANQNLNGNGFLNLNGNGFLVVARAKGNATWNNGNQIRCYNCRGVGHLAKNYTVRPMRRDAAYL